MTELYSNCSQDGDQDLIFHQLVREHTGCASYVIGSKNTQRCILVDPLMDTERYETFLRGQGLDVVGIVDTHTHADHLSGLRYFSTLYPDAILAMHEVAPLNFAFKKLTDGDLLQNWLEKNVFSSPSTSPLSSTIKVIYTPGHATDHICLLVQSKQTKLLLSGDCLFIGDVGRTDLGRGDNDLMYDSLFNKILRLDPDTEVYPAHVGSKHFISSEKVKTNVANERDTNPALQAKSKEAFLKYMTEGWPPKPSHYKEIIDINLGRLSLLKAQEEIVRAGAENLQQARY